MTQKTLDWLAAHEADMHALLEALVNTDSNSHDREGVNRVKDQIEAFLTEKGLTTSTTTLGPGGDALHARLASGTGNRPVLMMGHMDTVFPTGEAAKRPFTVEDGIASGPGCADMKAGLVMNAFVMAAFAATGESPVPLHALFTPDEEIGSPASAPVIEAAAADARAVFNSEPGRVSGNVVNGRRGGAFYKVTITGRAAHAGQNPKDGRSAIDELARKTLAWHALPEQDSWDINVNVGLVSGGQSVNTIAPYAECQIDLRYATKEEYEQAEAAIKEIALTCREDGVSATFERLGAFLPMLQTDGSADLTAAYLKSAHDLGQTTQAEFTRSCADSGIASYTGTPTLCATGPRGGKGHSPEEFLDIGTMVPRAQAMALTILRMV
ncbi:M20 family metallopeptidase [Pseudooceanicola sp. 502str34]